MLRKNLKLLVLSVGFLSLNIKNILPNILPGTLVKVGKTENCRVEDLCKDQLIVTQHEEFPREFYRARISEFLKKEQDSKKAVLIELKTKHGEVGQLKVGRSQYFLCKNAATRLKPKLLRGLKKIKKKALKTLINELWIKAKDLKVGDKLVGKGRKSLYVTKVEPVEFEKKQDFYDICLKHHHVYYLVDSADNVILTHNFLGSFLLGCFLDWVVKDFFLITSNYKTSKPNYYNAKEYHR